MRGGVGRRVATDASVKLGAGGADDEAENGVRPTITEVTFTPTRTGLFRWHCTIPCDGSNGHWAMSESPYGPGQNGYMAGYFIVR